MFLFQRAISSSTILGYEVILVKQSSPYFICYDTHTHKDLLTSSLLNCKFPVDTDYTRLVLSFINAWHNGYFWNKYRNEIRIHILNPSLEDTKDELGCICLRIWKSWHGFTCSKEWMYRNPKSHIWQNAHLQIMVSLRNKGVAQCFRARRMFILIWKEKWVMCSQADRFPVGTEKRTYYNGTFHLGAPPSTIMGCGIT